MTSKDNTKKWILVPDPESQYMKTLNRVVDRAIENAPHIKAEKFDRQLFIDRILYTDCAFLTASHNNRNKEARDPLFFTDKHKDFFESVFGNTRLFNSVRDDVLDRDKSWCSTATEDRAAFSQGYRVTEEYLDSNFTLKQVDISKRTQAKGKTTKGNPWGKKKRRTQREIKQDKYGETLARLSIDYEVLEEVLNNSPEYVDSPIKRMLVLCAARNFEDDTSCTLSEKVHRLYSWVTQQFSIIRHAVRIDGEPVEMWDIKSCSAWCMLPLFSDDKEKAKYLEILKAGFYEQLGRLTPEKDRAEVKLDWSKFIGGLWVKPRYEYLLEWFMEHFPVFVKENLKPKDKKFLTYYAQQTDAKIVVDGMVFNKQITYPVVSIHDAIMIKASDSEKALQDLQNSCLDVLGVVPAIEQETAPEPTEAPYRDTGEQDTSHLIDVEEVTDQMDTDPHRDTDPQLTQDLLETIPNNTKDTETYKRLCQDGLYETMARIITTRRGAEYTPEQAHTDLTNWIQNRPAPVADWFLSRALPETYKEFSQRTDRLEYAKRWYVNSRFLQRGVEVYGRRDWDMVYRGGDCNRDVLAKRFFPELEKV